MSNPFHHSLSSARTFGGTWEDYWEIHNFFDHSKSATAGVRHRSVFHHDLGIEMITTHYGARHWGPDYASSRDIGIQHVKEDFGGKVPALSEWLDGVEPPRRALMPSVDHAFESVRKFGGRASDYTEAHYMMDYYVRATAPGVWLMHNAFGIFVVEKIIGPAVKNSDGKLIPTRFLMEDHVREEMGGIPTLEDCVKRIPIKKWMGADAVKLSMEFA